MSQSIQQTTTVPRLPKRATDTHKGTYGKVLVMGGSAGMLGAPALVAWGALRGGAGLVTTAVPRSIQQAVTILCPCATAIGLPETLNGQINPAAAQKQLSHDGPLDSTKAARPSVLVVGPGLGRGDSHFGRRLWTLIDIFGKLDIPVVADADALNALEHDQRKPLPTTWEQWPRPNTVITPHPGELARLFGVTTQAIQAERISYAVRAARLLTGDESPRVRKARGSQPVTLPRAVVVLKGAGTIVTDGQRLYVNTTGNPGMATGGSGDVLSGLVGALIGQGMTIFDAAIAGVYLHGLAGDLAARDLGQVSLTAQDLIEYLPLAFKKSNATGKRR